MSLSSRIFRLALPSVMANITVPLLSLVDVAIVGHMGSASYIGAIAVGTMLFNLIYWLFGFLRMSTGGFTAQALGRGDAESIRQVWRRGMLIALVGALLLWVLQRPLCWLGFWIIAPSEEVRTLAATYYNICIWGAPAVLGLNVLNGWFLGMQNSRYPMYITMLTGVVNILVSLLLVFALHMKMEGVALGTLTAQYAGFTSAFLLWRRLSRKYVVNKKIVNQEIVNEDSPKFSFFKVNLNLFLRTLCLVAVTLFFTSAGARQGDTLLAVNALLMQFFTLYSYFIDGFAYAGEALTGLYMGSGDKDMLRRSVRGVFRWGTGVAFVFTVFYVLLGNPMLGWLTDDVAVILAARPYLWWTWLIPAAGLAAFLWDGIFVGATRTRPMLGSLIVGALLFFIISLLFVPRFGNHALWLAFITYLLTRGLYLTLSTTRTR